MKSVQDNCGVFGIWSEAPCVAEIYQGIDFLQHRGQEYCGIATFDGAIQQVTHHGKVLHSFTDGDLQHLKGNCGIGHVSLKERQPVRYHSYLGAIAVAFSGNIINSQLLIQEMMERGKSFWRDYDVEIIAKIIMEEPDVVSGLAALADKVKGA